jgi:hypothetical protein
MATPYGLTYGLAQLGSQMMPQYYAAQSRDLQAQKEQLGVEALREQMAQRRAATDRESQQAQLDAELQGAYQGLIRRDFEKASKHLGIPIREDVDGDFIITDPQTGTERKTARGEMFNALAGGESLARWYQNLQTQDAKADVVAKQYEGQMERQRLIGQQQMERQNRSFEQRKQLLELGGAIKARLSGMGEKGKAVSGRVAQFFALRQDNIDKGMSPPEADQNARDAVFGDRFKEESFALRALTAQLGGATSTWNMDDVNRFTAAIGRLIGPKRNAPRQQATATSDGRPSKAARPGTEWRNLPGIGWREIPVKK